MDEVWSECAKVMARARTKHRWRTEALLAFNRSGTGPDINEEKAEERILKRLRRSKGVVNAEIFEIVGGSVRVYRSFRARAKERMDQRVRRSKGVVKARSGELAEGSVLVGRSFRKKPTGTYK